MFAKLRQTTPFIHVLKSRVLSKKKFLQTLKFIGCRNRNTQLKFPQFRVPFESHCKWIPRTRNLPTRTTSKPPSWSSPQTRCKRWILQQCLSDKWQQMTTDGWQKTFRMVKITWRFSAIQSCYPQDKFFVELFVLFDPVLQRWIWKHQSTTAGPLSFEVVMLHVCWQSRKNVKSSQWRCLETSRWFRFEAKVSSFLSPEADQTRNQGFA